MRCPGPESGAETGLSPHGSGNQQPSTSETWPRRPSRVTGSGCRLHRPWRAGSPPPVASEGPGGARGARPLCPGRGRGAEGPESCSGTRNLRPSGSGIPALQPVGYNQPGTLTLPSGHSPRSLRGRARILGQVTTLSVPLRGVVVTVPDSEVTAFKCPAAPGTWQLEQSWSLHLSFRVTRGEQWHMWPWVWTRSAPLPATQLLGLTLGL